MILIDFRYPDTGGQNDTDPTGSGSTSLFNIQKHDRIGLVP